ALPATGCEWANALETDNSPPPWLMAVRAGSVVYSAEARQIKPDMNAAFFEMALYKFQLGNLAAGLRADERFTVPLPGPVGHLRWRMKGSFIWRVWEPPQFLESMQARGRRVRE